MPYQGERELRAALALLTVANVLQMRWAKLPKLYGSDIEEVDQHDPAVYTREERGHEEWQTAILLVRNGQGDCEDLAAYRAAELICEGETKARAVPMRTRAGWHIVVRRGCARSCGRGEGASSHAIGCHFGKLEDPSKNLGMNRKAQA